MDEKYYKVTFNFYPSYTNKETHSNKFRNNASTYS